jgi:hypothetical protein
MRRLALLLVVAFMACAAPAPSEEGETISIDPDAKTDAATEIKVKTTSLTVWMRPAATTRIENGRTVFVLRGRASKNLDAVTPFIADDGFAQARTLSARTFEVVLDGGHEINSMLSGLRLFLDLDVHGSTIPYTVALELQPRYVRFSGVSSIYVTAAMKPILANGGLVYRGRVKTGFGALVVSGARTTVRTGGPDTVWNVDAPFETLLVDHMFTLDRDGGFYVKTAGVDAALSMLGITTADPQVTWADSWDYECDPEVAACVASLPQGSTDTEPCGSYRDVTRCNQ